MIEESGLTPMTMESACSEAGRFGVYLRLIENKAEAINFYAEEEGFFEVFSFLFALAPYAAKNEELLSKLPSIGIEVYDRRRLKGDDELLYPFPEAPRSQEESRLDMALTYVTVEFGLSHNEDPFGHLPYLFSIRDELRPYVEAGYSLSSAAKPLEEEVRQDMDNRLPEDLYPTLKSIATSLGEVRLFLANNPQ